MTFGSSSLASTPTDVRLPTVRVPTVRQHHDARTTPDPRAERTRQLIFTAIRTLIADQSTTVSVPDIVRIAGISRSSFYAHFASLDVLAAEYLRAQFTDFDSAHLRNGLGAREKTAREKTAGENTAGENTAGENTAGENTAGENAARVGYARLVAHMVENFPLYATVLALPLTRSAYDQIVDAYATQMLESVLIPDSVPHDVNVELVTTYVAGGALTLISAWMRGQLDVSDDDLVDQLVALLPAWVLEPPT